ncbi:MAG: coiled-coil domain-containing protein [Bacillota bacterium]
MLKLKRTSKLTALCALLVLTALTCTSLIIGLAEPPSEIHEKLLKLSEEEKKVLQDLFVLSQEIEEMEKTEKRLKEEINTLGIEISYLEAEIAKDEKSYDKNRDSLKRLLQSYQRMGPGSYLEIILSSDSLGTLLNRINLLRDVTHNTERLLSDLEESKNMLLAEKSTQTEKLKLLEENKEKADEALRNGLRLKAELEKYLISLAEERDFYQQYLNDIQQQLSELKPFFSDMVKGFSRIVDEGGFPEDAIQVTISFFSLKGTIDQESFNEIMSTQADLPEMHFAFLDEKIEVSFPEKSLVLSGSFIIEEGNVIKFEAQHGSFYDMPLEPWFINELFKDQDLSIDLGPILGNLTIKTVNMKEGYLELFIR